MENGKALQTAVPIDAATMFSVVANGDISRLSQDQKLQYYKARCDAAGLDPRTAPFQILKLQGKEVLYAKKEVAEQMSSKHGIAVEILDQKTEAGVRTVTVRAKAKDGRQTDEIGCVMVQGLSGDMLCNAFMKAVTKAKRRAVLSICGLGLMDETEIETAKGAEVSPPPIEAEVPGEMVSITVADVKKFSDGRFEIMDMEGVVYYTSDENVAKAAKDAKGCRREVEYRMVGGKAQLMAMLPIPATTEASA